MAERSLERLDSLVVVGLQQCPDRPQRLRWQVSREHLARDDVDGGHGTLALADGDVRALVLLTKVEVQRVPGHAGPRRTHESSLVIERDPLRVRR